MKRLLATACFALLGAGAFAQTSAGTMIVSGSVGLTGEGYESQYNSGQAYNGNYSRFYVASSFGTFYKDKLEVGIHPGFSFNRNSSGSEADERVSKNYQVSLSPYVRKYFSITEKLYFTASASLGAGFGRSSEKNPQDENFNKTSKEFSFGIGASPGLTYFATEKLGFSIGIGGVSLSRSTTTYVRTDYEFTTTSFGASFSPSNSTIGILYIFNR